MSAIALEIANLAYVLFLQYGVLNANYSVYLACLGPLGKTYARYFS